MSTCFRIEFCVIYSFDFLLYLRFHRDRYQMERYKQALEIFLRIDKTSPNGDHEVCYFIGKKNLIFHIYGMVGDLFIKFPF